MSKKIFSNSIKIIGARQHNLKNISLQIPKNKFVVISGLSGSGKSSLAFDTIYAEGQRRYVESLSSYARQFLNMMEKPDVDLIEGSPLLSLLIKKPHQRIPDRPLERLLRFMTTLESYLQELEYHIRQLQVKR